MTRRGLTLLEVMIAIVILGLVGISCLELLGGTLRVSENVERWAQAVAFAEDAMESAKLAQPTAERADAGRPDEDLGGGFARRVERRPWSARATLVTVTVTLPGGGRYRLDGLVGRR